MGRKISISLITIGFVFLGGADRASAQSLPAMELLDEFIAMEADRASARKQTETSTMADASTTLVERSSISDFVGIGANLAGLSVGSGDAESADSASATVSLATFSSLLSGAPRSDRSRIK